MIGYSPSGDWAKAVVVTTGFEVSCATPSLLTKPEYVTVKGGLTAPKGFVILSAVIIKGAGLTVLVGISTSTLAAFSVLNTIFPL